MDTLESLYRLAGPALLAYLRRHLGRRGEAEELLQETFLIAARQPDSLASAGSPRAWLLGIARNLVRENNRRTARQTTLTLCGEPASPTELKPDDRVEVMRKAIDRLPEPQREVLELRLSQELSYVEIAEALAIPVGTVRSRLHNAIAALKSTVIVKQAAEDGRAPSRHDPVRRTRHGR